MEPTTVPTKSKGRILIKASIIGAIILLLQIPAFFVENIIEEREARQKEAIEEVSSKWAGRQNITGPMLVLPFLQTNTDTTKKQAKIKQYAYFLPDELNINASAIPQERYRGIFKIILFTAKVSLTGSFKEIHPEALGISNEMILWNEAFIQLNVSDAKGLDDELNLTLNNKTLNLTPQTLGDNFGFGALLGITSADEIKNIQFSSNINLSGSQQLMFTPIGKSTNVVLNSEWPHPSFTGDILPNKTTIKKNGFEAEWKSLAFKRNYPQQWIGSSLNGSSDLAISVFQSAFGADFFIPVNAYQKTMRSVKYSLLCIALTFAFFFIIETTNNKSVHPFQYGLIGLALILFYTLLLSFSEYVGFNISYIIASVATIGLIAWFVKGVLSSGRLAMILSVVLMLTYTYVFTILQLQDYALLLGSIGLFITLGVIMYFSRKIKW